MWACTSRKYVDARGQQWEEMEAFRLQFRRRHSSSSIRYPVHLLDLPSFPSWLRAELRAVQDAGEHVDPDIVQYGTPP